MSGEYIEDIDRSARRAARIREMKRKKRQQEQFRKIARICLPFATVAVAVILLVSVGVKIFHSISERNAAEAQAAELEAAQQLQSQPVEPEPVVQEEVQEPVETAAVYSAAENDATVQLGEDIISQHAILVNTDTGVITAEKDAHTVVVPASMTKVLTVLVAAEHVTDLDATYQMTIDITDYCYQNDCSAVGFAENETVTVRDLFYGTILKSGADAAMGLAEYVAGSQDAFVEMMNAKLDELGLSETAHFTNCVGTYDENHHCTMYDMAMIMEAAMDNELCREVLSAHKYTTSSTTEHPEGIEISNWFLRRIEDKDAGGEVIGGKTGYVVQSGNCAVSYAEDASGNTYVCATSNSTSAWRCIYDHVDIYKRFLGGAAEGTTGSTDTDTDTETTDEETDAALGINEETN
ncbi:MAG: serine hydrolase [bacterium]|nr:serine hydrolase [bacterium]